MAVAGMVSSDYEEELLWAATFTAANKELLWNPEESGQDGDTEEVNGSHITTVVIF